MMRSAVVMIVLLAATQAVAQVPEWHREVLIRANYGSKQNEYGDPCVNRDAEQGSVSAFYVGDKNIYIEDHYHGDVKIYDLSGNFLRTVTLERTPPRKVPRHVGDTVGYYVTAPPGASADLLVYDGVLYSLREYGGTPSLGEAAVYVLTYDLATGNRIERIAVHNPKVSAGVVGAAQFALGQSGTILIYDCLNGVSITIIRDGKSVPAAEHMHEIPGCVMGSRRVVCNRDTGREELVNSDGSLIRSLNFLGSLKHAVGLKASSKDGEYFLTQTTFDKKMDFTVSTWDGKDIGHVSWGPEGNSCIDIIEELIRIGPDGALYRVCQGYDALYVYRWSK